MHKKETANVEPGIDSCSRQWPLRFRRGKPAYARKLWHGKPGCAWSYGAVNKLLQERHVTDKNMTARLVRPVDLQFCILPPALSLAPFEVRRSMLDVRCSPPPHFRMAAGLMLLFQSVTIPRPFPIYERKYTISHL